MAIYVAMGAPSPAQAVAKELAAGSEAIAEAVTAKGVPTSAFDSLQKMADNIRDIQQETTVIDGGDMYANQLFGDGTLWNLYEVLAQMKSQFMGAGQYAALIVCEYYKGYDSLQLQGADAYYTCDGDFYDYASPNHVWHDSDNDKMNRWVAFLYQSEGSRLDITNTSISPRSMYIGGHIGIIEYFVNGRLTGIACGVEDTDVVDSLIEGNFTQYWSKELVLKNVDFDKITLSGQVFVFAEKKTTPSGVFLKGSVQYLKLKYSGGAFDLNSNVISLTDTVGIVIDGDIYNAGSAFALYTIVLSTDTLKYIHAKDLTQGTPIRGGLISDYQTNLEDVMVGAMTGNLNIQRWAPSFLSDADKKSKLINNIKNHILARVSDATGGTQLVFTVSADMYNAIASENITWQDQIMTLADAFLTKNWLLAGA